MEAWNRIAMAIGQTAATLGPADNGKPAHTHAVQPFPLLTGSKIEIGLRPATRPVIFRAIKTGRTEPVLPRKVETVSHAHPTLFWAIDEKQAAKRPEGLSAQVLLTLLINHADAETSRGSLRCRNQPGKPRPDNDHIIAFHQPLPDMTELLLRERKFTFVGRQPPRCGPRFQRSVSLSSIRRFCCRASGESPSAIG